MSILRFITRRVIAVVIVVFILVSVVFVLFRVMPMDPAVSVIHAPMTPEMKEMLQERFGLERPLGEQYLIYLKNVPYRDFGFSFYQLEDTQVILDERLIPTVILIGIALIIAMTLEYLAEVLFLRKSAGVNTLFYLIPFLWLGLLFLYFFSYKLDMFPIGGMKTPEIWEFDTATGSRLTDVIHHLILPLVVMVIWFFIGFVPLVKAISRGVISEKKTLLPVGLTTVVAASFMFFGAIVTETTFSWPGVHSLFVASCITYDYPLVQGAVIMGGLFALVVTVCVEVFYALVAVRHEI